MSWTDKDYFGNMNNIDPDTIEDALDMGAMVRFRKCEKGLVGLGRFARFGVKRTEWQPLRSMKHLKVLNEWTWDDPVPGWKWVELSYHLTDGQHVLLEAKAKTRDEVLRKEMQAEYEAWLKEQEIKETALLKKKPWLADPAPCFDMARECAEGYFYNRQIAPEAVC